MIESSPAEHDPPHVDTITVGGLAGTGTSTLCRRLRDRTGLPYAYAGQLFRDEAAARGLSLAEFSRLSERDPSMDRALDARQVALLREGGLILEGRLAGWLAYREELPALKVWVICEEDVRMGRVTQRDGEDLEVQRLRTLEREASEASRYRRYYDIELADFAPYDLVLDSTDATPDELADQVLAAREGVPPR